MAILPIAEKQGELAQTGGWQKVARRFQKGSLRKRGTKHPVWELQWWADVINPDRTLGRKRESMILGPVSELTRKQARKLAQEHLRPLNLGKVSPLSDVTFGKFIERHFAPNFLPTLKLSTQKPYLQTFKNHLLPAFGSVRLCEIGTLELQRLVLAKMQAGLGWESCDHLCNLMSKVFTVAKGWNFLAGENPASAVMRPQKHPVEEKKILSVAQIQALLSFLHDPCRTMVLLGLLTGMRIGEILGLRWKDVDLDGGQLRVFRAIYRGVVSTPKTKASRRILPLPQPVVSALIALRPAPGLETEEMLVFHSRKGTPLNDTNLLLRHLKPAGPEGRHALARLAHASANARHATAVGGWSYQRCASAVGPHQALHHTRDLHLTRTLPSAGCGRKLGANGDQW